MNTNDSTPPPSVNKKKASRPGSISDSMKLFVLQLRSLSVALSPAMSALSKGLGRHAKDLDEFIKKNAKKLRERDGHVSFQLSGDHIAEYEALENSFKSYMLAYRNVPITFLVSLVSQYDAYIGNLLRNAYYLKPDMLNASQRQLTFSELVQLNSVEAAREHLIEKEVESVLRTSHTEQFDWMESRFGIPLRKELHCWPVFIEVTERRNLFVHCDGIVSSQYLSVCKSHSCKEALPDSGDMLGVKPKYFAQAYRCLFELGVKLGQVLWRKLKPDEIEEADDNLNDICFDLLIEENFVLAEALLHFAVNTLKHHSSDISRRVFVINYAIALKAQKNEAYKKLLEHEDWSSCREDLQLAIAVLYDKYDEAVRIMKSIGRKGKPSESDYKSWPLFREFRQSEIFKKAYRSIFRRNFMIDETANPKEIKEGREQSVAGYVAQGAPPPEP